MQNQIIKLLGSDIQELKALTGLAFENDINKGNEWVETSNYLEDFNADDDFGTTFTKMAVNTKQNESTVIRVAFEAQLPEVKEHVLEAYTEHAKKYAELLKPVGEVTMAPMLNKSDHQVAYSWVSNSNDTEVKVMVSGTKSGRFNVVIEQMA